MIRADLQQGMDFIMQPLALFKFFFDAAATVIMMLSRPVCTRRVLFSVNEFI